MSRKELQALAKERGITANLSSAVIIEKILEQCPNVGDSSGKLSEEELREIAEFEVHFSSLRTFERKFEELQDEHARVMASMAELGEIFGCGRQLDSLQRKCGATL